MTLGTVKAEANFATAKELCRTGHPTHGCSYGGISSTHGYWLVADGCPLNHGDTCDLRTHCDGAPAEAGFPGLEPDAHSLYWIYRVMACTPCANEYAETHPEWRRP